MVTGHADSQCGQQCCPLLDNIQFFSTNIHNHLKISFCNFKHSMLSFWAPYHLFFTRQIPTVESSCFENVFRFFSQSAFLNLFSMFCPGCGPSIFLLFNWRFTDCIDYGKSLISLWLKRNADSYPVVSYGKAIMLAKVKMEKEWRRFAKFVRPSLGTPRATK